MADETAVATPSETPAPAETPAPTNFYLHTVEEKTWDNLTLLSAFVPEGVLRIHRPSLEEETDLRYLIRKIARARKINPDDTDGTIYDLLYLQALFQLCVDEPQVRDSKGELIPLDYFTVFNPKGRKQYEALQALQLEVFAWLSLFRDDEAAG